MRWAWALSGALLVAGCSELAKQPEPKAPVETPAPKKPSVDRSASPVFKSDTLKYLAKRRIQPQETRPLNVKSTCSHKDEIGTATKLDLLVSEADVKAFDAQVAIKGRGNCRFRLAEFDQAETMPQAKLRHKRDSDCTVTMWEQEQKVTIAFDSCPRSCDGDAFTYLWPIMVEAKTGRCF